ncbi:MAG: hypothetical protein KBF99_00925 [Leptospiraceae bacterium]|nr:hypothetical protein [Leptospiraceae bacterium]
MQRVLTIFLVLILLQASWSCQKNSKKLSDVNLFTDGFQSSSGLVLFNLLDSYPALKQPFKSVKVDDFNTRLDNSLRLSAKEDILGGLRLIQSIMLNTRTELQALLGQTANMLGRIQRNNPATYNNLQPLLERVRNYNQPVIRNVLPITTSYLLQEYTTKSSATISRQVTDFANTLGNADSKKTMEDYQDVAVKGIRSNSIVRAALESATNAFLDPVISGDRKLKNGLIGTIYGFGEMLYKRTGPSDNKTSETTIKELMVNAEKYYTVGGSGFSTTYSTSYTTPVTINSAELSNVIVDLYKNIRQLLVPPASPTTKDSTAILVDKLGENLQLLDFAGTTTGIENSLLDLVLQDSYGKDRFKDSTANSISALESLLLTLSIVDSFGYKWNVAQTDRSWITEPTYGQLNLGDSLWALQSVIQAGTAINFNSIMTSSKNSAKVFKNGVALTGAANGIDFNTAELSLLEAESIGSALPIESSGTDFIYRNTIPWVLNWVKRVTYSGYGPYYNRNKKDSSGNFLAPDGAIARYANLSENRFKPTWQTAKYKICISNTTTTIANCKDIGMGGTEYAGQSTSGNAANPGSGFTIFEIAKTDSERAVSSDEEAFYKNFQWLLYEKRFVVVIPARAKLDASLAFEEALFIVAIGNGLKGMMSLKPYCSSSTASTCGGASNGTWQKNTSVSLRDNAASYKDFTASKFSSVAGDSAVYVEGWGYGAAGNLPFQEALVLQSNLVWPLLIPNPTQVYGLIPPVISFNFPVLERLGFTGTTTVTPSLTTANWDKRNKLLPLIVALAKTLDDQADATTVGKNPFTLLTDLSKILSRPYLLVDVDNTSIPSPPYTTKPTLINIRLTDDNPIRSPTATPGEYLPSDIIFSPISFLVESQRRFQDGAIILVAKTDLLTNLVQMFVSLGDSTKKSGRDKIWAAVQRIMGQIKVNSDGATAANQYNLQQFIIEKVAVLAAYPDNRSKNVTDSSWSGVNDSVAFARDYFSKTSGYSLVKNIDFILDLVIDIKPTPAEVTALLDMLDSLLTKEANGYYNLTNILTDYVPPVLKQTAPYGRNVFGLSYSLASPGGFVYFLEGNMSFSPYSIASLVSDAERFLKSDMVVTAQNTPNSLLYSSGVLVSLFADIYQYGKKLEKQGLSFEDSLNINENTSVFQRLNIIFSIK